LHIQIFDLAGCLLAQLVEFLELRGRLQDTAVEVSWSSLYLAMSAAMSAILVDLGKIWLRK
jgi:hypothetical protein